MIVLGVVLAGCSSLGPDSTRTAGTTSPSEGEGATGERWTVTITEIVDGDTVKFRYRNGTSDTGRLLGVDTPEVHTSNDPAEFEGVPTNDAGASCLRDWGHKASEFARAELAGERVAIALDANEGPRDRYDRLLIYVRDDGKLFNYRLVSQGYARVYDSEFTKRDRFYSAESTAQRNGVGLWECRNARGTTQPSPGGGGDGNGDGGEGDGNGQLAVARIHADADGNDHDNLNGEYVVFENTGDSELDLSGWTISDAADRTYRVPSGATLAPGETVTLYTGGGSDSESELYWGSESAVWNNGGDTIIVTNADGTVVLRKEYSG
ncbi:lamin tail domain-containing protein [Haladaptatus salinisoli]|uniref:lamin tail domain-containing protein n=1 Tax=Haladaptatus salinisoli TaxID=2884876 RepID=UPI001D0AFD74|nr:lamin tail domain-containing protein [Haladaptatus salinisoli]